MRMSFSFYKAAWRHHAKRHHFTKELKTKNQTQPLVFAQGRRGKLPITLTDSRHLAKGLCGSLRDKLEPWALVRSANFA